MGNSTSKRSQACNEALLAFDPTEVEALTENFREACTRKKTHGKDETMDATALGEFLGLNPLLGGRLFKAMALASSPQEHGSHSRQKLTLSFDDFVVAVSKCCASQRYDRRLFWLAVMQEKGCIAKDALEAFFREELALAMPKNASSELREKLVKESVDQAFESAKTTADAMTVEEAERWLTSQPKEEAFFAELVNSRFLRSRSDAARQDAVSQGRKMPKLLSKSLLLKEEHLWMLAGYVPPHCVASPWKLLFSSAKHGKSFSRFLSKIVFKGPTVVVIRDKDGHVFGMFAAVSWKKCNKFYGEPSSFLFSLAPKSRAYPSSGVNNNYQFLSTNLTSCTNGLGMGGQMDFWGIHIGNMLEEGVCRAPCSTFTAMPCLASQPNFNVDVVEVWGCIAGYVADEKELEAAGVKKKHKKTWEEYENASKGKTCLDANREARAILDAAGRPNYSEDVRAADALAAKEKAAKSGGAESEDQESDEDEEEYEYD